MIFCPLYSGSSGNALFVQAGRTRVLIDAGLSGKTITQALEQIGVAPESLDAILITHEHSDHIKGAGVLSRRFHLPVYATAATWQAMETMVGTLPYQVRYEFEPDDEFYIGDLGVNPFVIPHDAAGPVGYRLYNGPVSLSTCTDLGYFASSVLDRVAGSDLVLLESNHDPDMLRANPHYPLALKQRILGRKGHLSNDSCAEALGKLVETGVRQVVLGHLSGENNLPELAYDTACQHLTSLGIIPGEDVQVDMAWRDKVGKVYTLERTLPGRNGL